MALRCKLIIAFVFIAITAAAQKDSIGFLQVYTLPITAVKNQAATNTCWSFATTSLLETEYLQQHGTDINLSEMFTVRNIYLEKAKHYLQHLGEVKFDEGGLGHDLIRAVERYGAMPERAYSGLFPGNHGHNHIALVRKLRRYLNRQLRSMPLDSNWAEGFVEIMDKQLGKPPDSFLFDGHLYTPMQFAKQVLQFSASNYINITSFTHVPYYEPFILEVPDNFSNGAYYNIPLQEMIGLVKNALKSGYSVLWDADVSNKGFKQADGYAILISDEPHVVSNPARPGFSEPSWNEQLRQRLYENLTTRDDHLMHIYGLADNADGQTFFTVKNSWGKMGPLAGNLQVSEAYLAINTISLVLPKAAISMELLAKFRAGTEPCRH